MVKTRNSTINDIFPVKKAPQISNIKQKHEEAQNLVCLKVKKIGKTIMKAKDCSQKQQQSEIINLKVKLDNKIPVEAKKKQKGIGGSKQDYQQKMEVKQQINKPQVQKSSLDITIADNQQELKTEENLTKVVESLIQRMNKKLVKLENEKTISDILTTVQYCLQILENLRKEKNIFSEFYWQNGNQLENLIKNLIVKNHKFLVKAQENSELVKLARNLRFDFPKIYEYVKTLTQEKCILIDLRNKKGYEAEFSGIENNQKLNIMIINALNQFDSETYLQRVKPEILNVFQQDFYQQLYNPLTQQQQQNESNQHQDSYDLNSMEEEDLSTREHSNITRENSNNNNNQEIEQEKMQIMHQQRIVFDMFNWTAIQKNKKIFDYNNCEYDIENCRGQHYVWSDGIPSDIMDSEIFGKKIIVIDYPLQNKYYGVYDNCEDSKLQQKAQFKINKQFAKVEYQDILLKLSKVKKNDKNKQLEKHSKNIHLRQEYY